MVGSCTSSSIPWWILLCGASIGSIKIWTLIGVEGRSWNKLGALVKRELPLFLPCESVGDVMLLNSPNAIVSTSWRSPTDKVWLAGDVDGSFSVESIYSALSLYFVGGYFLGGLTHSTSSKSKSQYRRLLGPSLGNWKYLLRLAPSVVVFAIQQLFDSRWLFLLDKIAAASKISQVVRILFV